MKTIPDFLNAANEYPANYSGYSNSENIHLLDDSLLRTINLLNELDNSLIKFSTEINGVVQVSVSRVLDTVSYDTRRDENDMEPSGESGLKGAKDNLEIISNGSEFLANLLKIVEASCVLPKGVETVVKGLELVGNVSDVFKGGIELLSSAGKGGAAMEAAGGAGDILAGALGIGGLAEVLTGPVGLAVMGGTWLAEKAMSFVEEEDRRKKKAADDERRYEQSRGTYAMSVTEANRYINDDKKLETDALKIAHPKPGSNGIKNPLDDIVRRNGPQTSELIYKIPQSSADNVLVKSNTLPGMTANFDPVEQPKENFIQRTAPVYNKLWVAALEGKEALDKAFRKEYAKAILYDEKHHTHTRGDVKDAGRLVRYQEVTTAKKSAKPGEGQNLARSIEISPAKAAGQTRDRCVTINLNKPMIENFTINTRDTKEAISDFKHKVEDALIEILNSANAI